MGSDDGWDQLSLTLRWVSSLLLPVPPRCSHRSAASLQSLISQCSRWKSSTYLSLPSLRPARPSLTCLFPNRIAPFSPSPSHLVPRLPFTIRLGLSCANAALFVFLLPPLFFFYPHVCFSSPSSFFFSFQPSQSQQSPSSYHRGPCVFSKVPLRPTLIQ